MATRRDRAMHVGSGKAARVGNAGFVEIVEGGAGVDEFADVAEMGDGVS